MKRLFGIIRKRTVQSFVLVAIILACAGEAFAPPETKLPFGPGEKLRYTVRWRLLQAGEAELSLAQEGTGGSRWKATAKAHSTGHVSNIYKVEDEYQSSFRNPAFCSAGIHKVIHEGERHREVKLNFDARRRLARLEDRSLSEEEPPKVEQFAIPECVHDILSAVYYARTQPLKVGETLEFPVNDGSKTIQIRVEVQAEEEVKTEIGKFHTVRVEPDVFSGNLFPGKGRMWVWISTDGQRVPVQLRAQISVGTITATLAGIEREETGK